MAETKADADPLCVFCLSPPFHIRPLSLNHFGPSCRRRSSLNWRRDVRTLATVRQSRFKVRNRRASHSILKNLTGLRRRKKTLTLQEVLDIIQQGWKAPPQHVDSIQSPAMDDRLRKTSSISAENPSPILLRRRLSAPETIMRKHMLSLQRSESQDSEATQSSECRSQHWRTEIETGSDSNLSGKKEQDRMRKSTLLKRLWSNSKPFISSKFPISFYEWQYGKMSSGRSTHSLTSIHSSPEHLVRSQSKRSLNGSPQHKINGRKVSPQTADTNRTQGVVSNNNNINNNNNNGSNNNNNNNNVTPRRKISVYDGNFEAYSSSFYSEETTVSNRNSTGTTTSSTSQETTRNTTSYSFSDNSDSAYTNSRYSQSHNNSTPSEIHKQIIEEGEVFDNKDVNERKLTDDAQFIKYSTKLSESSTQTLSSTNVNVISNVHLSQSTLDLIFKQVMQDVRNSGSSNCNSPPIEACHPLNSNSEMSQVPSFYLQQKQIDDPQYNSIVKYMISNVGTGSPYSRPAEVPQIVVPRYSALPRTTSMEVNVSSGDSTDKDDKESDTVSLADSLEEAAGRGDLIKFNDDKSVELPVILPDNSNNNNNKKHKPTAFFVPMEVKDSGDIKPVSDHLPDKVRERLAKRQQKLLDAKSKQSSPKSDSNYVSASDNGNQMNFNENSSDLNCNPHLPQVNYNKAKKRKPLLPSIKTFRRIKIDKSEMNQGDKEKNKNVKRRVLSKESTPENSHGNRSNNGNNTNRNWSCKSKGPSPVYTTKSEYVYNNDGPKKIYHKTEFNNADKRIEILEIMECIETSDKLTRHFAKGKSKIPVLINKLPKVESPKTASKPTFLDLNYSPIADPKLDQLIANILIETLNSPDLEATPVLQMNGNLDRKTESPIRTKYQQKFEVIPEELSLQQSNEDHQEDDKNGNKDLGGASSYKGKTAVAVIKEDNFTTIPQGWITFYMLQKNRGSPDSTSDEGTKSDNTKIKTNKYLDNNVKKKCISNIVTEGKRDGHRPIVVEKENLCLSDTNDNFSSSTDTQTNMPLSNLNGRQKRYQQKNEASNKTGEIREWSVTVSGTNSGGQFAPDLEMCLKFPESRRGREEKLRFPKIATGTRYKKPEDNTNNPVTYFNQRLPNIEKSSLVRKQKSSAPGIRAVVPSGFEPRQTRTSLRRYNLTRPNIEYSSPDTSNSNFSIFDDRNYADILQHLPRILSITGNAINSETSRNYH